MDASQARVRVTPGRLKRLKKIIGDCDRRIQEIDAALEFRSGRLWGHREDPSDRLIQKFKDRRTKLDAKRKAARLEAKGYGKHEKSTR